MHQPYRLTHSLFYLFLPDDDFGAAPIVFAPNVALSGCSSTLVVVQQKSGMLWILNAADLSVLGQYQMCFDGGGEGKARGNEFFLFFFLAYF